MNTSSALNFSHGLLDRMRQVGDPLANRAIASMFAQPEQVRQWRRQLKELQTNQQPIPNGFPEEVVEFLEESALLPPWANPGLMAEGSRLFYFYSQDIMSLLGYYSLPYCYASAKGVQVLHQSQRMGYDTMNRLAETGNFMLDVMAENAFAPNGRGIRSIQQVRLLHASIRHHISMGKWNQEQLGLPINQEDLSGTNLAFSLIILRGLRKVGHNISPEKQQAYIHLWAVIGHMLGIDEQLICHTAKEAYWLEKMIAERQFQTSTEGQELMRSLLQSFSAVTPAGIPNGFSASFIRYLLGNEIADSLNVPNSDWSQALVSQRKWLNIGSSLFQSMDFSDLPKRLEDTKKLMMSHTVVEPGYGIATELGYKKNR